MEQRTGTGSAAKAGFTYLSLLFFVATLGIGLAATAASWQAAAQREKERELMFAGKQIQEAIGLYYHRSPGEVKEFPRRLQDLLKDPRAATVERYLRKLYRDPLTGDEKWGLVRSPDGGIMGVYSLAPGTPIRTIDFPPEPGKPYTYQDWKFVVRP